MAGPTAEPTETNPILFGSGFKISGPRLQRASNPHTNWLCLSWEDGPCLIVIHVLANSWPPVDFIKSHLIKEIRKILLPVIFPVTFFDFLVIDQLTLERDGLSFFGFFNKNGVKVTIYFDDYFPVVIAE